ncbi:hypothetical protein QEZ54_08590 [Catellatospora sp. KI3]|uniref:hypothetical protein n=1 Tax=Catellatospora sp. KI3 TaxID=3041620 RepID=UPI002483017B|nr:hypothetical protein [Catellatospora sp. KI3]MDI1461019.1 hypothetical protein [Catellatospora sp. KI3]
MPKLVFIHGIGGSRDSREHVTSWIGAFRRGAIRAGHQKVADDPTCGGRVEIAFANYADLFRPSQAQGAGEPELSDEDAEALIALLVEEIDLRLDDGPPDDVRVKLRSARTQLMPPGQKQGALGPARRLLGVLTTLGSVLPHPVANWISAKVMRGHFAQVVRYLSRGEADNTGTTLDARIRDRVRAAIGDEPAIVVAHSLGSVVGLETLHELTTPVPLFMTMGSPIGMRTVVWPRLRPQPPRTPETVGRWLNFWDHDDVIVARSGWDGKIAPNTAGVVALTDRVDSTGLWVHPATTYLSTPGVAGPLAEAVALLAGSADA